MIRSTHSFRHRTGVAALAFLLLSTAASAGHRPAPPPKTPPITSRMVVEKQLDARATTGTASLSGAEARRIYDRYLASIGTPIETANTISGPNGGK